MDANRVHPSFFNKIHHFYRIGVIYSHMKRDKLVKNLCIWGVFAIIFISCKKDGIRNPDGTVVVQGNITLSVHNYHHSWAVPYVHVYLKKNAVEFPGRDSTKYEYSVQADSDGNAVFTNLYPGNYYLYATGNDYYFGAWVRGQSAVVLNSTTLVNNAFGMDLPMSE